MDNLHAAQMELNRTIEETHCLQSSQSVLLQVLEAEFEHFVTDHWRPMQAVVQHTRIHLPCTCPLHLAAQRSSPSPSSSSCILPHRRSGSGSDSRPNVFVTASENGSGSPSSVPPLVRESPPPTPREAYLPQRPERAQKREASEMRLTHPLAGRRARKTKQRPQTAELTQLPKGVEGRADQEAPLRRKQRVGVTPSH